MGLKIITPPTEEQISLVEARLHLRLDDDADSPAAHPDDTLVAVLITAARQHCEEWTRRALGTQTVELALDAFPSAEIELPLAPIQSITSVKYVDANEVEQTIAANQYVLDDFQEPGWLLPATDAVWPTPAAVINAVKVRYVAGYSLPNDSPVSNPLPAAIKAAMLLVLGHLYENREASTERPMTELPLGVQSLLLPYRLRLSMA